MIYDPLPLNKTITAAVYAIRNIINGKRYIGSAIKVRRRWYTHRHHLRSNKSNCSKLQKSWTFYGEQAFVFEIIEQITDIGTLIDRERFWVKHFDATGEGGLNILPPNEVHCAQAREKMKQASSGHLATLETRAKMSASAKGKTFSPETRARISAALKGKRLSPEHRAKARVARLGKKQPRDAVARTAAANCGKPRAANVKSKISDGLRLYWAARNKAAMPYRREEARDNVA